jgi:hypothetical protein
MGCKRNTYKFSVGEPEEKTPLENCRRRWKNNIEMDFE